MAMIKKKSRCHFHAYRSGVHAILCYLIVSTAVATTLHCQMLYYITFRRSAFDGRFAQCVGFSVLLLLLSQLCNAEMPWVRSPQSITWPNTYGRSIIVDNYYKYALHGFVFSINHSNDIEIACLLTASDSLSLRKLREKCERNWPFPCFACTMPIRLSEQSMSASSDYRHQLTLTLIRNFCLKKIKYMNSCSLSTQFNCRILW